MVALFARRCIAAVFLVVAFSGSARAGGQDADVIVAAGKLDGQFLDSSLFHVGEFWMRVPARTEFNRWLSQGLHGNVVILITTDPERFADAPRVHILSGTLIHETAPNPTPTTTDAVGRLPEGNVAMVHMFEVQDELTGSLGVIRFETADFETASKFGVHDDGQINIVIKIE